MGTSYRFGTVEVRPAERQLLVEGQPAPVGARAFDVLLALIDRRDRVVTKNELLDIVWPGLVVEENNLQVQVSTLRKHLGPRAVATIPGRGYRFTLEPETEPGAARTASVPRHNLPAQLNRFIGREREMAEVKALLESSRLVTLASLGGTGKTRLSLQVAQELVERYRDGVWFVELAPVVDEARITHTVAAALGVQEPSEPLLEALGRWAREREILIVLDNCEHVLRGCAEVAKHLLKAGPGVRILASSREPLRVTGEAVYPLSPLATPDARYPTSSAILEQYDAVRLFVERAMAANASFRISDANAPAVASICQRLDGIPLAIELAAARTRALSAENIAARLDDCFRLLTAGDKTAPARQQTLRASLEWSHDLLTPEEKTIFRRLAVFAGGWTLEAAEAVCETSEDEAVDVLDVLTRLVEKSLVDIDAFGERYRLLDTVRQFALEKLAESGDEGARDRHLVYYVTLSEKARPHLKGPDEPSWLRRLDQDVDNFLSAHEWCQRTPFGGELGLRLASSFKRYCLNRGLIGLAHRLASEALRHAPRRSAARAQALLDAGQTGCFLGLYAESRKYLEESIEISREIGDRRREALALQPLGLVCLGLGDAAAARTHLDTALAMARQGADDREIGAALQALAHAHRMHGDLDRAAALYEEAILCGRRLHDRELIAVGQLNLAMASAGREVSERASMVLEALHMGLETGSYYIGQSALEVATGIAAVAGDTERAARFYGAAQMQATRTGVRRDPADEAFLAPLVEATRRATGDARFAEHESAGRALSYDRAIEEVRAWLETVARSPLEVSRS